MSWTAGRITWAPWRCGGRLTQSQKAALATLITWARPGDYTDEHELAARAAGVQPEDVGVCTLAGARLADEAGCAERTMRTRLAELAEAGLVLRVDRGAGVAPAWVLVDDAILTLADAAMAARTPATRSGDPGNTIRGPRQHDPGTPATRSGVIHDTPAAGSGVPRQDDPGYPGSTIRGSHARGTHARNARVPGALDVALLPVAFTPPLPPAGPVDGPTVALDLDVVDEIPVEAERWPPASEAPPPSQVQAPPTPKLTKAVAEASYPDLKEPSGRSWSQAFAAAERRELIRQAELGVTRVLSAARAALDELVAADQGGSPITAALDRLGSDVHDVRLGWLGQGETDPDDLRAVLDDLAPRLQAAVARHVDEDEAPPPETWVQITPMLGRAWLAIVETLQALQGQESAA